MIDPRNRERYHPYQRIHGAYSREKIRDYGSSSEWRPKTGYENRTEKRPVRSYERNTDKHWERSRNTSPRNRASPDSQRTVSDVPRMNSTYYRGRSSRSPPMSGVEWRPKNRAHGTEISHGAHERRNGTDEPNKNMGEKAQKEVSTGKNAKEDRSGSRTGTSTSLT